MSIRTSLPEILAEGIRIASVASPEDRDAEAERHRKWFEFLKRTYPAIHDRCVASSLDSRQLVFRLPSTRPGDALPVLLMAHYDVVPAPDHGWTDPPFAGTIRDGAVWGRGALDNKLSHLSIMAALEDLLNDGYEPDRDIYLAFGGDEEIGGTYGAAQIARRFSDEGTRFAWVLDEGSLVADGVLPGVPGPVAVVGTAEKGHIVVRISLRGGGGHAAHPPAISDADRVIRAAARISRRRFPIRTIPTVSRFIRRFGSLLSGVPGLLLRLYPVTAPIVHRVLSSSPETDALLRDTRSLTRMGGSEAANVVPNHPYIDYNIRLLPDTKIVDVLAMMRKIVSDPTVSVELVDRPDNMEAPPASPAEGDGYVNIETAIRAVWPDAPILPYLFTMTSDSRHYTIVSERVYRFLPFQLTSRDLAGIHGVDEHVSLENIDRAYRFYTALLQTLQ